ncbi:MAG: hypothetical protein KJ970_16790 [Candidatus Eisenbacteria bacterium]|uniref:Uncharacterized protein n=1 Tax=Eiseniibacteriota bacterium TaxID=2212470 RepID=A0A948WE99_UNCEI|nr:hypothetical protein [Candidatus Eisenbacteria bacterium]MBU1948100.1 hypothetical protein [Candidatus Eisenbacteria bacterium]MBU2692573.1 hypothetical protein [Candidatus Eisenbacteria bacterium]
MKLFKEQEIERAKVERIRIEILRRMTPQRRLEIALGMNRAAWALKEAWLREIHPEWDEDQIQKAVREAFLYAQC